MTQYTLTDLQQLMACLRDPEAGCPWDVAQDFVDIVPFTLEEAYEVADAIERQDFESLPGELGDLFFQVIFYTQIAKERDQFTLEDVIHQVTAKLLARHPHVFPTGELKSFGKASPTSVASIKNQWETTKSKERAARGQLGLFDDVPHALPATTRARKIQKRAARVGFDWDDVSGVWAKLDEEVEELRTALSEQRPQDILAEFGDLLFTVISLGRHIGVDTEQALRFATRKFESRMTAVIHLAEQAKMNLEEATDEEKEHLWVRAKARTARDH